MCLVAVKSSIAATRAQGLLWKASGGWLRMCACSRSARFSCKPKLGRNEVIHGHHWTSFVRKTFLDAGRQTHRHCCGANEICSQNIKGDSQRYATQARPHAYFLLHVIELFPGRDVHIYTAGQWISAVNSF